jgi:hypothetical protein
MKVTARMIGEAIHTATELEVVQRTSQASYRKWLAYVANAAGKAPAKRTEAEARALRLAMELPQ